MNRFSSYYGFSGTPSAMFDGTEDVVGGNSTSMYSTYLPIVQNRLAVSSPLQMSGGFALFGVSGTVDIDILVTDPVTGGPNTVHLVVVEDGAHGQVNLARLALPSASLALTQPGESVSIHRDFQLQGDWNQDNLRVLAWVQNDGNHEVLQSCTAVADYVGTVVVDVTPDGLEAGWTMTGPGGFLLQGTDDRTVRVFATGDYSVAWDAVPGWGAPQPAQATLTLEQDSTVVFATTYTDPPLLALPLADTGHAVDQATGVAIHDVDGDHDLDIYLSAPGEPNTWYRNDGAGQWTPVTTGPLADSGQDRAAVFADYDGDGRDDVYLVRAGEANVLLHNDGAGAWHDATYAASADTGNGVAAAWVDHDGDGLLDLYVVNLGGESVLLKSYGDFGGANWFFGKIGSVPTTTGQLAAAVWADDDADGDQDVYLVFDGGANVLYRNEGSLGYYAASDASQTEDPGLGRCAAWGDYDNDGDLDLLLGNDVAGASLFARQSNGYVVVLDDALGESGDVRGCAWGDYDNDGDLDLYLARAGAYDRLLRNEGDGSFTAIPLGIPQTAGPANACAWGDVDGDGDLDLCVAAGDGQSVLLLNNLSAPRHWLAVNLVGTTNNTDAVGARVRVVAGGVSQLREVSCGGTAGQSARDCWFGLGDAATVDSLVVRWPDGQQQVVTDVPADWRITLVQGGSTAAPGGVPAAGLRLAEPYPNPFNPEVRFRFTLPREAAVEVAVYDGAGRRVRTLHRGRLPAGEHRLVWRGDDDRGRSLPSGTYLVRVRAGGERRTTRVTLVK